MFCPPFDLILNRIGRFLLRSIVLFLPIFSLLERILMPFCATIRKPLLASGTLFPGHLRLHSDRGAANLIFRFDPTSRGIASDRQLSFFYISRYNGKT